MAPRTMPLLIAFAATYLLWGATFLGIRVAVETYPPFWLSGLRFLLAGGLVQSFVAIRGPRGEAPPWTQAIVTGALFCLGTHGIAPHVSRTVASGVVAVFMAATPLLMSLISCATGNERCSPSTWAAVGLGVAGVVILAWPSAGADLTAWDAAWMVGAALCWAVGSVLTKQWGGTGIDVVRFAGRQMVAGAVLLGLASGASGQGWLPEVPDARTGLALVYLVLGGTIVAYFSYLYLLQNVSIAQASSYTFVNPVVAVALGFWLGGEAISVRLWVALPIIVAAVALTLKVKPAPVTVNYSATDTDDCAAAPDATCVRV